MNKAETGESSLDDTVAVPAKEVARGLPSKVTTVSPGMKYIVVMENTRWQQIYNGNNHSYKVSQLTENTEYRYRVCAISVAGQGPFSSVFAEAAINDLELWHKLEKISEER